MVERNIKATFFYLTNGLDAHSEQRRTRMHSFRFDRTAVKYLVDEIRIYRDLIQ